MERTIMTTHPDEWTIKQLTNYLLDNNVLTDAKNIKTLCKSAMVEKVVLFAEEHEPEPLELIMWETVRADMKLPVKDNNEGFIYGLYILDLFTQVDIQDVQWCKTEKERQKLIQDGNFYIIYD